MAHAEAVPRRVAVSAAAAAAAGERLRLIPAELAGDRLQAPERRREVLGRDGAGDSLAQRAHLPLEAVAGLTAGVGELGREAVDPASLRQAVEHMGLGAEPVGEPLVAGGPGEQVQHPPVAAGDAVGGEERLQLR